MNVPCMRPGCTAEVPSNKLTIRSPWVPSHWRFCDDHTAWAIGEEAPNASDFVAGPSTWYALDVPVIRGTAWLPDGYVLASDSQVVRAPYLEGCAADGELRRGIGGLEGRDLAHAHGLGDYGARWAQALRGGWRLFHEPRMTLHPCRERTPGCAVCELIKESARLVMLKALRPGVL